MTDLQELLTEEYKELIHSKAIYTEQLRDCEKGVMRIKQLKYYLKKNKNDLRRIKRALGPFLIYKLNKDIRKENKE